MKILIIADIHANLLAFESVLSDCMGQWDYVWCLGDIVGYGCNPNECIELLQTLPNICIAGNHEWAVLSWHDARLFNPDAKASLLWTQTLLKPTSKSFLQNLPMKCVIGQYMIVHGSPREPTWEYMLERIVADFNFPIMETRYCFVGHSHQAMIYRWDNEIRQSRVLLPTYNVPFQLSEQKHIINIGSVGWAKGGVAEYGMLDTKVNTFEFHRARYDTNEAIYRMRKINAPENLIDWAKILWSVSNLSNT